MSWVDIDDLMCRTEALSGDTGSLGWQVLIKTSIDVLDRDVAPEDLWARAYRSPIAPTCPAEGCDPVAPIRPQFVYAEADERYLIAPTPTINAESRLVGWVEKDRALTWETGLVLRPRLQDEIEGAAGQEVPDDICLFDLAATARAHRPDDPTRRCSHILSRSDRWLRHGVRLPVAPVDRPATHDGGDGPRSRVIGVDLPFHDVDRLGHSGASDLEALKTVVVMFVVDGTGSMAPTIDALLGDDRRDGIVQQISRQLGESLAQSGGEVFLGFQIYGDTSNNAANPFGTSGLGESHPSGADRWDCLSNDSEANNAAFEEALRSVVLQRVEPDDGQLEDFAENVWGGMIEANSRMRDCQPGATRIMIVIGDHGYNPERQAARQLEAISQEDLVREIGPQGGGEPLLLYFIQTPFNYSGGIYKDYETTYENFGKQAREILAELYAEVDRGNPQDENLIQLPDQPRQAREQIVADEIAQVVLDRIREVAEGGTLIDDLIEGRVIANLFKKNRINNESFAEGIDQLLARYPQVSKLFADQVIDKYCMSAPEYCGVEMANGERTVYVAFDETWVEEVPVRPNDFRLLESILDEFEPEAHGPEAQAQLLPDLVGPLKRHVRLDPEQDEEIGEFIARAGYFPLEVDTPLLSYTFEELRDPGLVPTCEIEHLQNYAGRAARILAILQRGDRRPIIETAALPETCPFTDKGRRVPNIVDVREGPWVPDDGTTTPPRISYDVGGEPLYWVPIEYLP